VYWRSLATRRMFGIGDDFAANRKRLLPGLNRFNEISGRHEETRTPDLYRVNQPLACDINNLTEHGSRLMCLKKKVRANSGYANVPGLCTTFRPKIRL
jgi:hypothetical protein